MKFVKFNNPALDNFNFGSIVDLNKRSNYSTLGHYSEKCSLFLKKKLKVKKVLMTKSCTAALEMAAILLKIKTNDEVIFPSYSYVSTINSFVMRGAKPKFADIDKNNLCIDLDSLENKLSSKTKAVVITNYAGGSCDLARLIKLKKKYKFYLVEDCAQSLFSKFKNKNLGTFGDLSTISFHQTKNIHCGEDIVFCKGTNRILFEKGKVEKYTWQDLGSSFALSELHAIILNHSFKIYKKSFLKREKIWNSYHNKLKKLQDDGQIRRPIFQQDITHNCHLYYILVKKNLRDKLIKYLKKNSIITAFHYQALHKSKYFKKKYNQNLKLLNSENIQNQIIRLPLSHKMNLKDVNYVVKKIEKFFSKNGTFSRINTVH